MAHRKIGMSRRSRRAETVSTADADTTQLLSATDDPNIAPERLLALFAAKDLDALIDTAFHVLQEAVECDFASAFYRSTGDGLFKQRDSRGREYGPALMRRYMELTPALQIAMANRGIKILPTRTALPRSAAELRRTEFYREIMQPQCWRHAVALCFWGAPPAEAPTFVTSVYRREGRHDFSKQDIGNLERIHPFIDCAVNRLHEREVATTVRDGITVAMRDGTPGFAILDRNLSLVQANPVGRQLCAAWADGAVVPDTESSVWHLPPVLQAACRDVYHEWQSLLRADPDATGIRRDRPVLHPRIPGLTAWITLVCPNTADLAEPTFVLELDRRVHGVALDTPDQLVPILQKMTVAERAVAMVLADGFSNQEIADQLGKSVDAVKFLLHRIYQKTGVPSRAALVAVLRARPNRRSRKSHRKRG
jgi:DNA-binding CsgD family transcriptional regulator